MQKVINIQHKLKVLKDILTGEKDISILRPPQYYCVMQNINGLYEIPGTDLLCDKEMLEQWLLTVRECDHVVVFECDERNEPITDNRIVVFKEEKNYEDGLLSDTQTLDVDYVEVDPLPAEISIDEKPKRKTKRLKTPVNASQEAPLALMPKRLIREGKLSEYGITWGSICGD